MHKTCVLAKSIRIALFLSTTFLGLSALPSYASDSITKSQLGGVDYPPYPEVNYGTGAKAAQIKHGEYLSKAGDCIACHTDTKNNGIPFAGGLGIYTPFGTFYSPNITPDKETGIGNWSDADFIRVMHEGIRPNGTYSFPVFPYIFFTKVSDKDLLDIKAYLFSLKPVHKVNLPPTPPWPISWRFAQLGWRILFFDKGYYKYDPQHTSVWNRGAYLVQGLGHCSMCHTPINFLGAPKNQYYLTGAFVGGYFAPDITSYGLKGSDVAQVEDVFTQEEMLKGAGAVQGPMAEVDHDSLKYLSSKDLFAISIYLKTVKSKEPKSSSGPITAGTGKKIYEGHCAVCHGTGAAGAPKLGNVADWAARIAQGTNILDQHAINGFNSMPPKGTCMSCSDDEIKAAVQYLTSQSVPGAASVAPPTIAPPPKPTMADGKRIYEANCSVCHAQGTFGAPKLGDKAAWTPLIAQNIDVLFAHTINGYKRMPARGACTSCTNEELEAAVKYMAQESSDGNYSLW